MLPDPFQAHNPLRVARREDCWTRLSRSLLGLQTSLILQPLSNPLDGGLLLRLLCRRRCLEAHCRLSRALGRALELATYIQQGSILFSHVIFPFSLLLLFPLSALPRKKKTKRSLVWPLAGGVCTSSNVVYFESISSHRLG
jgi:hypothetical protein